MSAACGLEGEQNGRLQAVGVPVFVDEHVIEAAADVVGNGCVAGTLKCRRASGGDLVLLIRAAHDDPQGLIGQGRCSAFASSQGARIQISSSSSVVRMTGIAFSWIGSTTAFASVVRKRKRTSPEGNDGETAAARTLPGYRVDRLAGVRELVGVTGSIPVVPTNSNS